MTQKIINKERFEKAQNYEGNYWKSRQHDPVGIIHDLEGTFALAQHLQREGYLDYTFEKFLDLGCGGLGVGTLWLIQAKEKYALDPLPILRPSTGNLFIDDFIAKIQDGVRYHQGGGGRPCHLKMSTLTQLCATTSWTMSTTPYRYFLKFGVS